MKKGFLKLFVFLQSLQINAQTLETIFEKTNGNETATYFEVVEYYRQLDKKYNTITIKTFDTTDSNYPLHLVLFSPDKHFDVAQWHRQDKVIILINNGIHPGEPDGIDASMMLLHDLCSGKLAAPSNVVLAIIPVYNIGGALNRNSFSRVNQQGPVSYGFRGNAQNLDLNRDFSKCDSRNAKAFTDIFHYLNPDIFIDNHVSDGADYQHTMTLLTTVPDKLQQPLSGFLKDVFEPAIFSNMNKKNWPMIPYANFYRGNPDKGWMAYYDPPRYSSGYAALFQTLAFVPETHMLKPFKERVRSTYALMQAFIEESAVKAAAIKQSRRQATEATRKQKQFALTWRSDTSSYRLINYKGYETGSRISEATGLPAMFYNRQKPFEKQVKFFDRYKGENVIIAPKAYIIPQGWKAVIELLQRNKVQMSRFARDTTITVDVYRVEDYKTVTTPYEKHYKHYDIKTSTHKQQLNLLKGDFIVYTDQPAKRYLVEMLEPGADDSFFSWNFFDAVLQQKEGYSDYRWDEVAAAYLKEHPELKKTLIEKKLADTSFAESASAQLNFIYKNSPYYEAAHMRYPVYRLTE